MSKLRVVICTDGVYPQSTGGMQKHSRLLIEELAKAPEIHLIVIHPHPEKLFCENVEEISVSPIDESRIYLLECYAYSKRVYNKLQTLRFDVIYSQGLSVWYKASVFAEKLILNPHGLEPFQALGWKARAITFPIRLVFESLFKKPAILVSLGGKLTEILQEKRGKRTSVVEIPNAANSPIAVPERQFATVPIHCLFVGRVVWNKGIDILFSAIRELKSKQLSDKFYFTIVGTGPLLAYYKSRYQFENVCFTGYVSDSDMPGKFRTADLFVFPTLFEGMPTVVIESMSYGLPVLVSDVGATRVLVDDTNGKLLTPGSVGELVNALEWFAKTSPQARQKLGTSSVKKFYAQFTWREVAAKHIMLFQQFGASKRL